MKTLKTTKSTTSAKINDLVKKANVKGNVKTSLIEILKTGSTTTGYSGYSSGWAKKEIWTTDVVSACINAGLVVTSGNDAPRGGASGEYVMLVADLRKNKLAHKYRAICKRMAAIRVATTERKAADFAAAKLAEKKEVYAQAELLKSIVPNFEKEIIDSRKATGSEKCRVQDGIMKRMMAIAGVDKLTHYWQVWRVISNSITL